MFNLFKKKQDETVESLANKLIMKLKEEGKSIAYPDISEGLGSVSIFAHDIGTEVASLSIESNNWKVKVKPYFEKF
ncbi:MAG: hypothetical protein K0R54_2260 [Clostridiaceae bacterium]|nr:hypothetical protein [Clostridiaceae bacterium]